MTPEHHFFLDLGLLFGAALVGGGIAQLLRQPLVLGYLLGGVLVGPFTPGPTISDPLSFQTFADIGVVLLMFSIGLEFSLGELLRVRRVALLGAPLGTALITLLAAGLTILVGWPLRESLVLGASVSIASTMVLSKFLIERGELNAPHGRVMIGISIAEDLVVVILTVVLQAMGGGETSAGQVLAALGRAVLVLLPLLWLARRAVPHLFAKVAATGNMELFLLVAMAVAIGTAALTANLGLSLALGAFLAGLVISESEFAHEALARVLPVRDVFVAVFFVSMGTLIPPQTLVHQWLTVLLLVLVVIAGSPLVWTGVIRVLGHPTPTAVLAAIGLSQIGEFSYVIMGVARHAGLVSEAAFQSVLATSALTILANSLLFRGRPAWLSRWLRRPLPVDAVPDSPAVEDHAILCGFGRVGREVADALDVFRIPYTVVDLDPEVIAVARQRAAAVTFGESGSEPVLRAAGVERTRLVVVSIPDFDAASRCVQTVRRLRPDVPILVRVHQGRFHALMAVAGATTIVQPEMEAGLSMARYSLDHLDVKHRLSRRYIEQKRASQSMALRDGNTPRTIATREITMSQHHATDGYLTVANLRARTGVTIASVQRLEGDHIVDPAPDKEIRPGDRMAAIGTPDQLDSLETVCRGRQED